MKRTMTLVLGLSVLLSSAVMAADRDWSFAAGASASAMTQYTFRGLGLSKNVLSANAYGMATYKGWLTPRASITYYQSLLQNNPFGGQEEIYDLSLTAMPSKWYVAVTGGWTYYDGQIGGDLRELYAVITAAPRAKLPFNAGLAMVWGYNMPYYAFIPHASKSWALPRISPKLSVGLYGEYAHVFSPGFDAMSDFKVAVSLPYQISKYWTVTGRGEVVIPGNWVPEPRDVLPGAAIDIAYNTRF